jgi:hypothetical protein
MKPKSELILYQTEDNRTRITVRLEDETVWLTQAQMAELFQTTPQNITLHLKDIFSERELVEEATCKEYLQVRQEGERQITRGLRHYRLDSRRPASASSGSPPSTIDEPMPPSARDLRNRPPRPAETLRRPGMAGHTAVDLDPEPDSSLSTAGASVPPFVDAGHAPAKRK